jgi:glycine/D-amino acid oxidase-like deaminating enzyme
MKRIVIVGAGFAGLAAAKALSCADPEVLVIESGESQPLSTSALSGGDNRAFSCSSRITDSSAAQESAQHDCSPWRSYRN